MEITLILHNIRSSYNVGSLFRTADAVGVSKVILSGYTPTPIGKFERENKEISKTALGAEKTIQWDSVSNPNKELSRLKADGFTLVALELHEKAVDYRKIKTLIQAKTKRSKGVKIALILGNEVKGVSSALLKKMDIIAEIPMNGKKESLNVSVAGAVMLFSLI
jgi:tRNA G18 (ribose-2'-O)-methylase SpoU